MIRLRFALLAISLTSVSPVAAQALRLPRTAATDSVALAEGMPGLARAAIARWQYEDRDTYLNTLFRLQIVAGQFAESNQTLAELRRLRWRADTIYSPVEYTQYQLYSAARVNQAARHYSFAEGFKAAFDSIYRPIDGRRAWRINSSFGLNLTAAREDLEHLLAQWGGADSLPLRDAIQLIRAYQLYQVYRSIAPLANPLLAAEQTRRYLVDDSVLVRSADGTMISVIVAIPRGTTTRLPAIFMHTIYADNENFDTAIEAAANGYAGVVANTRGKRYGTGAVVPYEHDGDDARAVIDWISRQHWSNGAVGMYGGSYAGFTQWAAAGKLPPALKTIVPSAAVAPGFDAPMENGVFQSFQFPWIPYVTDTRLLDNEVYGDRVRWAAVDSVWFARGLAYRSLDSIAGIAEPLFQHWLDHPAYDAYWQAMTPQRSALGRISIPILSTTGYFDGAQPGALHYYREQLRANPAAEHYLVIGPWDHFGSQRRPAPVVAGYRIDPAAQLDIHQLIFDWFDYILCHGPKPALLFDRVNYEVMGTNSWRHTHTLAGMSRDTLTLYLNGPVAAGRYRLSRSPGIGSIRQRVDLTDRTTQTANYIHAELADTTINQVNGLVFVSDTFPAGTTISGAFTGQLHVTINKKDVDLGVQLFELTPRGEYFQLSYYLGRASLARDRTVRQLLTPGVPVALPISNTRVISAELAPGSRLVVVVSVNKDAQTSINYGTGKDVSRETIADAGVPLEIRWSERSFLKIPIQK